MNRNTLRATYNKAKAGNQIAGVDVVAILNHLAVVEFELDCTTLSLVEALESSQAKDSNIKVTS